MLDATRCSSCPLSTDKGICLDEDAVLFHTPRHARDVPESVILHAKPKILMQMPPYIAASETRLVKNSATEKATIHYRLLADRPGGEMPPSLFACLVPVTHCRNTVYRHIRSSGRIQCSDTVGHGRPAAPSADSAHLVRPTGKFGFSDRHCSYLPGKSRQQHMHAGPRVSIVDRYILTIGRPQLLYPEAR